MSAYNVNQILARNIEILKAQTPLFINLKCDAFIQDYVNLYPQAQLSCYNTNFEEYCGYKSNKHIKSYFTANYQTELKHDLVVMAFPKSKAELNFTLSMISHATTSNTNVIIVGENKSGIKTLSKAASKTLINCNKYDSARHCILFTAQLSENIPTFSLNEWYEYYKVNIADIQLKIAALPGVFSQKGLDKGTHILLENLPNIKSGNILDFGCGAGVIASYIGRKHPEVILNLLDVSALALQSSIQTLKSNNLTGKVFASNSLSEITDSYDVVVSNPPFHQGIATNYSATESFLEGIKTHLKKEAEVIVVANSFLKYEPIMQKTIGLTNRLLTQQGFTIYQCKT